MVEGGGWRDKVACNVPVPFPLTTVRQRATVKTFQRLFKLQRLQRFKPCNRSFRDGFDSGVQSTIRLVGAHDNDPGEFLSAFKCYTGNQSILPPSAMTPNPDIPVSDQRLDKSTEPQEEISKGRCFIQHLCNKLAKASYVSRVVKMLSR